MKILVINLKREKARRFYMDRQLSALQADYKFVEATDALNIDDKWIADNLHPEFKLEYDSLKHRFLNKGALACADSHRRAWRQTIRESAGDEPYLVLEDDCLILKRKYSLMEQASKIMGEYDLEFILLYYTVQLKTVLERSASIAIDAQYRIYPYPKVPTAGAVAYMVTAEGARKLLSTQADRLTRMADSWDFEQSGLRASVMYPRPVETGELPSTILRVGFRKYLRRRTFTAAMRIPGIRQAVLYYKEKKLHRRFVI